MILELSVTRPSPMLDLQLLHQNWLTKPNNDQSLPFTTYYPAVLSLKDTLEKKGRELMTVWDQLHIFNFHLQSRTKYWRKAIFISRIVQKSC